MTATSYSGPIVAMSPRIDEYETTVGIQGTSDTGGSVGSWLFRCLFRASSSGGFPTNVTGNFFISAVDAAAFTSLAAEFGSFRVLGAKLTVISYLTESTDGFGAEPVQSTILRENTPSLGKLVDTPGFECHPVCTGPNVFHREMRMLGLDESEWVDCGNAYTAISPQPAIVVQFSDEVAIVRRKFFVQWRVQFRGRQ